ncbi:uroporphyrinogen-III synthase-like [Malaya genurostris]|uniref:uroporphyrinogen-III synthase-like n=1 Tax=Malaya genurostris TaxID=325434 RepID=UPI0026F396A0|nr:uroporphyrinogen-III synthase-like [Malaya genurostris]
MKKVVILKSENDNSEVYTALLQKAGFEPVFIPTLDFCFKNLDILRDRLLSPYKYSGLIFTSPRSITAVRDALGGHRLKDDWKTLENYCVGEPSHDLILTSLELETKGQHSGNASNLADVMKTDLYNKTITLPFLFPCGNLKQDVLQNKLSEYGYSIDCVEVYETIPHEDLELSLINLFRDSAAPDFLLFFSPSGIDYCGAIFERHKLNHSGCKIVAIGPSTKKAIENKGYTVHRTAEKPSPEYVVSALLDS